jgi:hypothetical protein
VSHALRPRTTITLHFIHPSRTPLHSQCQASGGGGGGRGGAVGPKQPQFTCQQMRHARSRSCPPPHGVRVRGRGAPHMLEARKWVHAGFRDDGIATCSRVFPTFSFVWFPGVWVSSTPHTARTRCNPTETRFTDHQALTIEPGNTPKIKTFEARFTTTTTVDTFFRSDKFQTLPRVLIRTK